MDILDKALRGSSRKGVSIEERIEKARGIIEDAEIIVIGAGAGLSIAAGLDLGGERFERYMAEFGKRYGYHDMYSGDFYDYDSEEEFWAFESKSILVNRYDVESFPLYRKLFDAVKERDYFVITTNVDSQFFKAGFPKERVFATQGDYGLFQCEKGCHKKLYNNEEIIRAMVSQTKEFRIPSNLIPICPVCGRHMKTNLRSDSYFVEDESWNESCRRYLDFTSKVDQRKAVYMEFGVGYNTPAIIRFPFERYTYNNPNASLIRFNRDYPEGIEENKGKTVEFKEDIEMVLNKIFKEMR